MTVMVVARMVVLAALVSGTIVAATHWAVRSRRLNPFGAWARFVRKASDPLLLPLERRVARAGGNPQDATYWLLGIVVVGGLVVLGLAGWSAGAIARWAAMAGAGPRGWLLLLVRGAYTVLTIAIFARVIGSWLGVGPFNKWMRPAYVLTDWLVRPIQRVLPPFGMFDLSPLAAWLLLIVARSLLTALIVGSL